MHYGQMFQSHALHFFHLCAPDFLFGFDADPAIRNVIGVALVHKDLAVQGVLLRKFGQEIIQATAGKKIHGTGAIPGGINKNLSPEERDSFLKGAAPFNIDQMIDWAGAAVELFKDYHEQEQGPRRRFRRVPLEPPQPRPQGRRSRLLPRRPQGGRRRRAGRSWTTSTTRTTSTTSARRSAPGAT